MQIAEWKKKSGMKPGGEKSKRKKTGKESEIEKLNGKDGKFCKENNWLNPKITAIKETKGLLGTIQRNEKKKTEAEKTTNVENKEKK